jgi:hypothetical protein
VGELNDKFLHFKVSDSLRFATSQLCDLSNPDYKFDIAKILAFLIANMLGSSKRHFTLVRRVKIEEIGAYSLCNDNLALGVLISIRGRFPIDRHERSFESG